MSASRKVAGGKAVTVPRDWEDDFRRLKEKYDQLKMDLNEKEKHNLL